MIWILQDPVSGKKMTIGAGTSSHLDWKLWEEVSKSRPVVATLKGTSISIRLNDPFSSDGFRKKSARTNRPWSRFVEIRPTKSGFTVRTSRSNAWIQVGDLKDLSRLRAKFGDLLDSLGFLEGADSSALEPLWEATDLGFHQQSLNFRRGPWGGTYRFGKKKKLRFKKKPRPEATFALKSEKPGKLAEVLRARRSNRQFNDRALSLPTLAAFLQESFGKSGTPRPFPSAGGIYEQELYLVVAEGQPVPPGFYRYESKTMRLEKWAYRKGMPSIADWQKMAMQNLSPSKLIPPIVGILTSKHALLAVKYERIAYRLSLLNAGCFLQAAALSASQRNLAYCPLGAVNPQLFEQATGIPMTEESPVAAFALGTGEV